MTFMISHTPRSAPPPDRRARRNKILMFGLLVGMAVASAAILYLVWATSPDNTVRILRDEGANHVSASYPEDMYVTNPPATGPHVPEDATWGEHLMPLSWDAQLHALGRGGVILHYNCPDGCADDLAALRDIVQDAGSAQLILHPYPDMTYDFAATAWARILALKTVERGAIEDFIADFRGISYEDSGN